MSHLPQNYQECKVYYFLLLFILVPWARFKVLIFHSVYSVNLFLHSVTASPNNKNYLLVKLEYAKNHLPVPQLRGKWRRLNPIMGEMRVIKFGWVYIYNNIEEQLMISVAQASPDTQLDPEPKSVTERFADKANESENKVGDYILSKCIGSGAFGKVYLGLHLITGEKVAIKVIEKQRITKKLVERVKREIKILCMLHHPCIVQLYELIEKEKHIYLVMEYVSEGELFSYIVKSKRLSEKEACTIFQQLILAVEYFHRCGVAHRDLKPENVLIDANKRIKVIDFGLSNVYDKNDQLQTACGSPCYVPPEMIEEKCSYDPIQVDIWSAGVILYAMLCGCLPFMDDNPRKIYQKIKIGHFKVPKSLSFEAKTLIAHMLSVDPSKRIKLPEIKAHKWWQTSREPMLYGIVLDQHQIPIDMGILEKLSSYSMDTVKAKVALQRNLHIPETASYYLLLKKSFLEGNPCSSYLGANDFDPMRLEVEIPLYEDVDSTEIQEYMPPTQSSTAPLADQQGCDFEVFLPWDELYHRIAQLTDLKNNIFLKVLLQKNSKRRPHRINSRYPSKGPRNMTSSQAKEKSLNLPHIKEHRVSKHSVHRKSVPKQSPERYSGYFSNLSSKHLEKLKKIRSAEHQSVRLPSKQERTDKEQCPVEFGAEELAKMLESLTTKDKEVKMQEQKPVMVRYRGHRGATK